MSPTEYVANSVRARLWVHDLCTNKFECMPLQSSLAKEEVHYNLGSWSAISSQSSYNSWLFNPNWKARSWSSIRWSLVFPESARTDSLHIQTFFSILVMPISTQILTSYLPLLNPWQGPLTQVDQTTFYRVCGSPVKHTPESHSVLHNKILLNTCLATKFFWIQ